MTSSSDEFPVIKCSRLVVKPLLTSYVWDIEKRSPNISVSGNRDIAYGTGSILGNIAFTIGTTTASWKYGFLDSGEVHVGLAQCDQILNTLKGVDIQTLVNVLKLDNIEFILDAEKLIIKHIRNLQIINTWDIDITPFLGQVVYGWIFADYFNVQVYENIQSLLYLEDGKLKIENASLGEAKIGDICISQGCVEFKGDPNIIKFSGDLSIGNYIILDSLVDFKQPLIAPEVDASVVTCGVLTGGQLQSGDVRFNNSTLEFSGTSNKITFNTLDFGTHMTLDTEIKIFSEIVAPSATFTDIQTGSAEFGYVSLDSSEIKFGTAGKIQFNGSLSVEDSKDNFINLSSQVTSLNQPLENKEITLANLNTSTLTSGNLVVSGGQLSSANINLNPSGESLLAGDPLSALGAATKQYVDLLAQGLDPKGSVRVVTSYSLPAYTPIGSTLVSATNVSLNGAGIDSITDLKVGEQILITTAGSQSDVHNGLWEITQLGAVSSPFILTRLNTIITASAQVNVEEGATCANTSFILTTPDPIVVGTTPLTWVKFAQAGLIDGNNVGSGSGIFRDKTDTNLNFKRLGGTSIMSLTDNSNDITIDIDQSQINQVGDLVGGSISGGFGSIVCSDLKCDQLDIDSININGSTISSLGDIKFTGQVLLSADPTLPLAAATKDYVDNIDPLSNCVNLGTGSGVFAQFNGTTAEFKSLTNADGLLSIASTATDININFNQTSLTEVGALTAVSLGGSFGPIANTSTITGGKITATSLTGGDILFDGNVISSLNANGNIYLDGDEVLVNNAPNTDFHVATKSYVDGLGSVGAGVSSGNNLGGGAGVFAQVNLTNLEFKSLKNVDGLLNITSTSTEINIDLNETSITQVGALNGGSISAGFGNINAGSITAGAITAGELNVDTLNFNGSTLTGTSTISLPSTTTIQGELKAPQISVDQLSLNGNILSSTGDLKLTATEILLTGSPSSALSATPKSYVDSFPGSSNITQVGALSGGSISVGFGSINVGTSPINGGTITGTSFAADNLLVDGNTISAAGNLNFTGTITIGNYPLNPEDALTKEYVDSYMGSSQIVTVGALSSGSISPCFGDINNGTSPTTGGILTANGVSIDNLSITTTGITNSSQTILQAGSSVLLQGFVTTPLLRVNNTLRINGNTIDNTLGDVRILPQGSGQVLLKADPTSGSALATKKYIDDRTGSNIILTGALNVGSITTGFGNINVGTSPITGGTLTGDCLDVGSLTLDGSTLSSSGNLNLSATQVLATGNPTTALGAATKGYVDSNPPPADDVFTGTLVAGDTYKLSPIPLSVGGLCTGGVIRKTKLLTSSPYNILNEDVVLITYASRTINLPQIGQGGYAGRKLTIVSKGATSPVVPASTDKIAQSSIGTTLPLNGFIHLISDGVSTWMIVS